MKRTGLLALALSLPLIAAGVLWFAMGPLHDWQGKRNTLYSSKFSLETFAQVTNGMTLPAVIKILGPAFSGITNIAYPAWAVSDAATRQQSNIAGNVRIEWQYFSQPKNYRVDYEWVHVCFGPGQTVIDKHRYVTD